VKKSMRVAVIGGGVAGAELIRVASPSSLEFTLIEPKKHIELQALYPEYLAGLTRIQDLTAPLKPFCDRVGANYVRETALSIICEVKKDCILFSDNIGTCLDCDMAIWTAGVKPSQFVQNLDFSKKNGWIEVDPYLRTQGNVFAIGDCAWVEIDSKLATKTGLEAERQAKHTARNIMRLADGKPLEMYTVRASTDSQVVLISLGGDCAVGVMGKMCIGAPTRLIYSLKSWIDKSFIKRFT
jgi:NADH dehydrogenase FAD-containing subunit